MLMAYVTKKDHRGYIDFRNLVTDYSDGDAQVYDDVKDISRLYPLKPMTNLIILCGAGQVEINSSGRKIEAGSGDVLICPPNMKIADCIYSNDFVCKVISLSDHLVQGLLRDKADIWHRAVYLNQMNLITMSNVSREEFKFYFALISSKVQNVNSGAPHEILLALIRALLLDICFIMEDVHGVEREQKLSQGKVLFNRFLNLLSNSNVKRQPITYYASQLAITPKYLTMLCQKYSDKTASQWVIQYTTEEIRFYLKSSDLSIKQISAKLGFSNMSHFGSYVRKHLGMSPSEYRYSKR